MKTPDKNPKAEAARQKKQYLMLGGLSAVLVAVIAIQFGGGGDDPSREAAAMTEPPPPTAEEGVAEDSDGAPIVVPAAADNAVLSQPVAETRLPRSPFSNFWSTTPSGGSMEVSISVPAPTITLNATMPSETTGLAVIDGQLRFQGDSIQGWLLAEVRPRAVLLRATSGDSVVVEMPLIAGRISLPASAAPLVPAVPAVPAVAAEAADG